MGYGPTDMISEWVYEGDLCFVYDPGPYYTDNDPVNPWNPDHEPDEYEDDDVDSRDPRNASHEHYYGIKPEFDPELKEDEILRLHQEAKAFEESVKHLGRLKGDERFYYSAPYSYYVAPDGFITCSLLQAYAYYDENAAVSARSYLDTQKEQARAKGWEGV